MLVRINALTASARRLMNKPKAFAMTTHPLRSMDEVAAGGGAAMVR
jgi:hypothetical protein